MKHVDVMYLFRCHLHVLKSLKLTSLFHSRYHPERILPLSETS
jgi:hypothetical protein